MHIEKLFDDPTEGRIINNRLFNGIVPIVLVSDIPDANKQKLINLITLICKKLIGIYRHLDRYSQVIDQERERLQRPGEDKKAVNLSDELFLEYDEFLVQVKSTLDHLVKAPTLLFGKKYWNLHTFGEKGAKVKSALGNLPKDIKQRAKGMDQFLVDRHMDWLTDTIDQRDMVNHCLEGGIDFRLFAVRRHPDGTLSVPMWSPTQPIEQGLEAVWANLFQFTEDFLASFLNLKLPLDMVALGIFDGNEFPKPTSPWRLMKREQVEQRLRDLQDRGLLAQQPLC